MRALPSSFVQQLCLLLSIGLMVGSGLGCSLTPGGGLVAFPHREKLSECAEFVRQQNPHELAVPRELEKTVIPAYIVEPGDVLLVQAADFDSPARLPTDQPVLADGTIDLGRYGRLMVAGQTAEEIEETVTHIVNKKTKDAGAITVRIIERQSKVFYVLGEVNAPGAYTFIGRETVLDGILTAGGLTDRASRDDIIVSRPTAPPDCRVVLPVCYTNIVQLGDTTTNYQLMPGDRIYVTDRNVWKDAFKKNKKKLCERFCCGPQCRCPEVPGQAGCVPMYHPPVPCPPTPTFVPPSNDTAP
ncbi:Polysaccharide biosynthesis/export protein [Planctomycetes bacterium Pan216]|uniref:Polysaccharide biosynthesis/export protein n=1 Tax=Kolteria novifilia TaxID=2527975 RepID=A0A518AZA1_9BACT|nr:Polysaccharide biosynthesis/export protein [Planctomycetes bacterium Pan216]